MATRKKMVTGLLTQDKLDYGTSAYQHMMGVDEMRRNEDGFITLQFSAQKTDERINELTTDISAIEEKLKKYKAEKNQREKFRKTEEYKESKKKLSKKKQKKKKMSLLEMVFNDADHEKEREEELEENMEEDGGTLVDKKPSHTTKKPSQTTLNTTYGKRFSPVVSMLHDTIMEFDGIAEEIQADLNDYRSSSRTMYRSSQIGNLISAKKSKLDAIKELASVSKVVSDLEYKKEKDKKEESAGNVSKEVSSIGAKFLRGSFDLFDSKSDKKKKDEKKKKNNKVSLFNTGRESSYDDEEEDEDFSIKAATDSKRTAENDQELAVEFSKALERNKDSITFTPAERYVNMEGKYNVIVVADVMDVENTWKFVAVDPKSGKEIPDFKEDYPGLLPRKKKCRMKFDLSRMKCTDLNSSRTYKLIVKE